LDSGFRRNDGKTKELTVYKYIKLVCCKFECDDNLNSYLQCFGHLILEFDIYLYFGACILGFFNQTGTGISNVPNANAIAMSTLYLLALRMPS
jgi:hypothetical protein